jgi:hypothetical protein
MSAGGWGGVRVGAGPKGKTLAEHVRDRTFRVDRHGGLLASDSSLAESSPAELGVDRYLCEALVRLQRLYVREPWRHDLVRSFARLLREAPGRG